MGGRGKSVVSKDRFLPQSRADVVVIQWLITVINLIIVHTWFKIAGLRHARHARERANP
jgi:hypothetical protein